MRRTLTSFSLAFGIAAALNLGALTPAAQAADFGAAQAYTQGINPYGAATPVPAPIPVPVFEPAWYFRVDFAAGFGSQPSVDVAGTPFGSLAALRSLGFQNGWLSEDFLPSFTGGVGVGYVWGAHVRTDFTVDVHSIMTSKFIGSETYNDGTVTPKDLTVNDKTRFMSTILLMNAYYDFRTGTAFSPYVGGGLGFAVNQLTRSDSSTDSGATGALEVSDRTTRINFAGAAMAGLTYDINSIVSLDVGYRYLFIGGTDVALRIHQVESDLTVGNISEQQVRAGLRFYID
jgi:opacity protein-like surface antigen